MIKENKAISSAEALNILKDMEIDKEKKREIETFLKKFVKLDNKKATELRKEIESLDLIKIKSEHISKIIDILPEDASDINKIFSDVALNEDETNKILEIVKKYR